MIGDVRIRTYHNLFDPTKIETEEGYQRFEKHVIVIPGSVGAPREGMEEASCAMVDIDTGVVELCAVPYDFKTTQNKLLVIPELMRSISSEFVLHSFRNVILL